MNNQSVMGEWDIGKLAEMKIADPDIDFVTDFGFDTCDISVMFSGVDGFDSMFVPSIEEKTELEKMEQADKFKEAKKQQRENIQAKENETGDTFTLAKDDYTLTVVFSTTKEKQDFMQKIGKKKDEKYIKPAFLYDIAEQKIQII